MLPKTSAYVKGYDEQTNGCIFSLKKIDDVLEIYDTIWDKVCADIKKEFDSKPDNKKHLKTKTKSHGNKVTDFSNKKNPKRESNHTSLAVISGFSN